MKITKTMEMVSTSNFKKVGTRAANFRAYADGVKRLIENLAASFGADAESPLLKDAGASKAPQIVLVITSNRGLCGSYNSNVINVARRYIEKIGKPDVLIHVSGKKGIANFRMRKYDVARSFTNISYLPSWPDIETLAAEYLEMFVSGKIKGLAVVFMKYLSAGKHAPEILTLLPMAAEKNPEFAAAGETTREKAVAPPREMKNAQYLFSPRPEEMAKELLPLSFKVNLYRAFIDAGASEQAARMRAMKNATSAAEKMIKILTQLYNRARQTQITMELLDIIGGVQGLTKK